MQRQTQRLNQIGPDADRDLVLALDLVPQGLHFCAEVRHDMLGARDAGEALFVGIDRGHELGQ